MVQKNTEKPKAKIDRANDTDLMEIGNEKSCFPRDKQSERTRIKLSLSRAPSSSENNLRFK